MTEIEQFDLITLGAGSGGVAASRRAAAHGARVLIVEADRVGGTCVIRGCVPKKLMMYAAGFRGALDEAAAFGWTGIRGEFEMARWADAKRDAIDRLEGIYRERLAQSAVTLVAGRARLVDARTVRIGERSYSAPRILVAVGGAPASDAIPGLAAAMTSNELLELREVPRTLTVIGGGYIAVEFASIMAGLGAQVTLACRDQFPLRGFDPDLRPRLSSALQARGVALAAGVGLVGLERTARGFALHRADGSSVESDAVLNATGRRPNTAGIGLEAAGVALDAAGAIRVDQDCRTTAAQIWAIGDVTNRRNLTPVAIAEGRAFADREFGAEPKQVDRVALANVATAVFTEPPIGTVGLTEPQASALGPVAIYEADFRPMKSAFHGGALRTYMKLVVDGRDGRNVRDGRVLGVHMIGNDAPEIIQSIAVALTCGATKHDFDRTLAVHPTVAEELVLMREPVRHTVAAQDG